MTVSIKYNSENRITNIYWNGEKESSQWVNIEDSDFPDQPREGLAEDESPIYYYNENDGITVQSKRIVIPRLHIELSDRKIVNDGTDSETVIVYLINDFVADNQPELRDIEILNKNNDINVKVDDSTITKTLSNGSLSFEITTEKSSGSAIEIIAESIIDNSTKTDKATIEVFNP